MVEALEALYQTHVWDLVLIKLGKHMIGYRWVYKIKTHNDGSVESYKARFVVKGYGKKLSVGYEESFAPVAKIMIVCTLIVVSTIYQCKIYQFHVKNEFLNGYLHEEIYMFPPLGIIHQPCEVFRLRKVSYGLKQAFHSLV